MEKTGIKSYVKRSGRITKSQKKYLFNEKKIKENLIQREGLLDFKKIYENDNDCIVDIGFGNGDLLKSIALKNPNYNFLGIDVYEPGIGQLIKKIKDKDIKNLKIICEDAVEVLKENIKENSLYGVSIFFPDPWPKKRHQKRRLINKDFINLLEFKIKNKGFIKIATDWKEYALEIENILSNYENFRKVKEINIFKNREKTKFEKKGICLNHIIYETSYEKIL